MNLFCRLVLCFSVLLLSFEVQASRRARPYTEQVSERLEDEYAIQTFLQSLSESRMETLRAALTKPDWKEYSPPVELFYRELLSPKGYPKGVIYFRKKDLENFEAIPDEDKFGCSVFLTNLFKENLIRIESADLLPGVSRWFSLGLLRLDLTHLKSLGQETLNRQFPNAKEIAASFENLDSEEFWKYLENSPIRTLNLTFDPKNPKPRLDPLFDLLKQERVHTLILKNLYPESISKLMSILHLSKVEKLVLANQIVPVIFPLDRKQSLKCAAPCPLKQMTVLGYGNVDLLVEGLSQTTQLRSLKINTNQLGDFEPFRVLLAKPSMKKFKVNLGDHLVPALPLLEMVEGVAHKNRTLSVRLEFTPKYENYLSTAESDLREKITKRNPLIEILWPQDSKN